MCFAVQTLSGHRNIIRPDEGSFAQVIAVKAEAQFRIPDTLSEAEAAAQGVAIATMVRTLPDDDKDSADLWATQAQALYRGLGLALPGTGGETPFPMFIYGGSTAMGMAAIQFAKLSGATVIATASPANKAFLEHLGADHVVDYNSPGLVDEVRSFVDQPIHFAFDAYADEKSARIAAELLSRDGKARYVCLIPGTEEEVKARNPTVDASSILAYSVLGTPYWFEKKYFEGKPADFELQKSFVLVAEKLLEEGKLKAPHVFLNRGGAGLEGLLHGLEETRAKNVRGGKLVYTAVDGAE